MFPIRIIECVNKSIENVDTSSWSIHLPDWEYLREIPSSARHASGYSRIASTLSRSRADNVVLFCEIIINNFVKIVRQQWRNESNAAMRTVKKQAIK